MSESEYSVTMDLDTSEQPAAAVKSSAENGDKEPKSFTFSSKLSLEDV